MEKKQFEVTCPCCSSRLLLDVRSQKIVRSRRPEQLDEAGKPKVNAGDWDDALGRVQTREAQRDTKLDDALRREENKSDHLDDLFKKASERAQEDDQDDTDGFGA